MHETSHLVEMEERPNLRAHVTRALRAAVITGELEAGRIYSAPVLAASFGVSATPVREAMLDLIREGLVTAVRNKGYRVSEISDSDLDQITAVRMLLEPPAVAAAVARMSGEAADRLLSMAEATVAAAAADDLMTYLELDRDFHLRFIEHCGNPRLVQIVRELRSQTRLYGLPTLAARHDLATTAEEHVELVALARAGDGPAAEALMRRHLTHVRGLWALSTE